MAILRIFSQYQVFLMLLILLFLNCSGIEIETSGSLIGDRTYSFINKKTNSESDDDLLVSEGNIDQKIEAYNKCVSERLNDSIHFGCYNNLGTLYIAKGNYEKSKSCFMKAIQLWPERAYYPYMGLASIAEEEGDLKKAAKYSGKATELVNNKNYYKLETDSEYSPDSIKYWVIAHNDYLNMKIKYGEFKRHYSMKNYKKVKSIANELLDKDYYISLGIDVDGKYAREVGNGSIAELNGILAGDEILRIDDKRITNYITHINALASLYNRFGDKVGIQLRRKGREITILAYLYLTFRG